MKRRKNYLHTKFIKFLVENEKQILKDTDEVDTDKVDTDEVDTNEVENDDDLDADEVIESLYEKIKRTSKEYDDIIYGRK